MFRLQVDFCYLTFERWYPISLLGAIHGAEMAELQVHGGETCFVLQQDKVESSR